MPLKLVPPRAGKSPYWYVRGTYLGRRVERSTKARKRQIAAKILHAWEAEIERGVYAEPAEPTFASAALDYMNAGGERKYLYPIIQYFGNAPLSQIKQAELDRAALTLYPGRSAATVNRHFYTPAIAVLRRAGVALAFRRPEGAAGRQLTEWLWPEQAQALIAEAFKLDSEFGLFLLLLLYTGLRLGEALNSRIDRLRVEEGYLFVPTTKNEQPRGIYLPPILVAEMRLHPRGLNRPGERIFKFHKSGHIYHLLRAAAARAGVTLPEREAFHIFCHTYATWMRRYAGLDLRGLVGTQRWTDIKSTARYAHVVSSEEARRAANLPSVEIRGKQPAKKPTI